MPGLCAHSDNRHIKGAQFRTAAGARDKRTERGIGSALHTTLGAVLKFAMSVMDTDIQWFIARDGKQHGPLSDAEIRKLVELGHMRPTDLIWRQGFPDWRTAAAVFPM